MKAKKHERSIAMKLSRMAILMIVLCAVVIGVLSFALYSTNSINDAKKEALGIASAAAAAMDPVQLKDALEISSQNEYLENFEKYLDDVKTRTDIRFIYALRETADGQVEFILEGQKPGDDPNDRAFFGKLDVKDNFAAEAFVSYETGEPVVSDFYNVPAYGELVSAVAPIKDADQNTIAVMAVDYEVTNVLQSSMIFGLSIVAIIAVISLLCGFYVRRYVNRNVGRPINDISDVAKKMSKGDTNVTINFHSDDEIGHLATSFHEMITSTREQIEALEVIADGDLTVGINERSSYDLMSIAMKKMVKNLSGMVSQIRSGTAQVLEGSKQVADGATHLAQGSMEQSGVVNELSRSITEVSEKTRDNAHRAETAAELTTQIQQNAEHGATQMEMLQNAVVDINESSNAINKIIRVIDDIAFQTNILALNAAVEAARAGAQGKGFAVVADEVRNLAAKSADAAKETGDLITASIQKADDGAKIAKITAESLSEIVAGIGESTGIVREIAQSSIEQNAAIEQINHGIEEVTQVVSQNTATAEQSAAASQEMSSQSQMLNELVAAFKIKE